MTVLLSSVLWFFVLSTGGVGRGKSVVPRKKTKIQAVITACFIYRVKNIWTIKPQPCRNFSRTTELFISFSSPLSFANKKILEEFQFSKKNPPQLRVFSSLRMKFMCGSKLKYITYPHSVSPHRSDQKLQNVL